MDGLNKRLLVITELFLPTKGGTAVWFDEVYRRLGGKGVHVVTAAVPGSESHDEMHPNTIHRVSLKRYAWLKPESLAMYVRLFKKALGVSISDKVEEVHCGRVLPEGLVGWLVARMLGKPLRVYAHGEEITTWRQPAKFRIMGFVYRHSDTVIANSEFTREELLKLGVDERRIALISPGVNIQRFRKGLPVEDLTKELGMGEESRLILSVGRLSRRKGFDTVVKGIGRLVKRGFDVHYAIVGTGQDKEYLEKLAARENVSDRVHMLGHVSMEDLPRWYNACDFFVMPNREIKGDNEGFGMVFIEAAACGKTAIAGNAGGTGNAVLHDVTGLRVNGEDVDAVVDAMRKLLSDEGYRARLENSAYERAVKEFSWESVAERTREVMEKTERP